MTSAAPTGRRVSGETRYAATGGQMKFAPPIGVSGDGNGFSPWRRSFASG